MYAECVHVYPYATLRTMARRHQTGTAFMPRCVYTYMRIYHEVASSRDYDAHTLWAAVLGIVIYDNHTHTYTNTWWAEACAYIFASVELRNEK